jgi:hypothetical protein
MSLKSFTSIQDYFILQRKQYRIRLFVSPLTYNRERGEPWINSALYTLSWSQWPRDLRHEIS